MTRGARQREARLEAVRFVGCYHAVTALDTAAAAKRSERVLWNDPATGDMRHADAGYAKAIDVAKAKKLNMPTL